MTRRVFLALAIAASAVLGDPFLRAQQRDDPGSPRATAPVTILQINDVYSTVPVDEAGGLARVAALKRQLAASGRQPFLVIAGDFLSSSVASTIFKGEQMVAALNAAGLDLATLGNHEFDFGVDLLLQRMKESRWQWVISNVIDRSTNRPLGNAAPYVVRTFGGLKVGFIGLCLASGGIRSDTLERIRLVDPLEAAATYLPALRKEQVDVTVALTHLTFAEDRALADRFPEIDLIIGGHEHFPIAAVENRTFISKAGSDARFVARIDLLRRPKGAVERFYELVPITAAIEDDPKTAEVVNAYQAKLGTELKAVIGSSRVPLDGATARLRASETNLGNLVADAMRTRVGADAAVINSGGIRGDRVHEPGPITRFEIVELHPFGNVVCTVVITGKVLLEALNHAVSRLPDAAGQFPQVSGIRMEVDVSQPAGNRVRAVTVQGQRLDPGGTYTVAIPDFMLLGGDGYKMFAGQKVVVGPESGPLMTVALEEYVAAQRELAPTVEGRIVIDR
jgi:5'-nucleotidase